MRSLKNIAINVYHHLEQNFDIHEEEYFYLTMCSERLSKSITLLDLYLSSSIKDDLACSAYRMAIIEYCKPFKNTHGKHKRYVIDFPFESNSLHNDLLSQRDKMLAHTDIFPKLGRIHYGGKDNMGMPLVSYMTDAVLPDGLIVKNLVNKILDHVNSLRIEKSKIIL